MESSNVNIKLIFGSVMGAVILAVVVLYIYDALDVGMSYDETFTVTDPAVDQECELTKTPGSGTVTVRQYTGAGWETISSGDYTIDQKTVTVSATALYG